VRLADGAATLHTDRCHSLSSLNLPQAALASLPLILCRRMTVILIQRDDGFLYLKSAFENFLEEKR